MSFCARGVVVRVGPGCGARLRVRRGGACVSVRAAAYATR